MFRVEEVTFLPIENAHAQLLKVSYWLLRPCLRGYNTNITSCNYHISKRVKVRKSQHFVKHFRKEKHYVCNMFINTLIKCLYHLEKVILLPIDQMSHPVKAISPKVSILKKVVGVSKLFSSSKRRKQLSKIMFICIIHLKFQTDYLNHAEEDDFSSLGANLLNQYKQ